MSRFGYRSQCHLILGEALAKVRKLKLENQIETAEAVSEVLGYNINHTTVSSYERGLTRVPIDYVAALCKVVYGDKWVNGVIWILGKAYNDQQ